MGLAREAAGSAAVGSALACSRAHASWVARSLARTSAACTPGWVLGYSTARRRRSTSAMGSGEPMRSKAVTSSEGAGPRAVGERRGAVWGASSLTGSSGAANSPAGVVDKGGGAAAVPSPSPPLARISAPAISSATARKLTSDLAAHGSIQRPRLGIAGERQRLYEGLVKHHDLKQTHGVYLHDVQPGSPAGNAELRKGDIIVGADSAVIEGLDDLHRFLISKSYGDTLTLRLLRELDLLDITVTLTPPAEQSA